MNSDPEDDMAAAEQFAEHKPSAARQDDS